MGNININNKRKSLLIISLHASPSMPPGVGEWGGTHTYMRELLTELQGEDYEIVLITRKVYPYEEDFECISPSCKIMKLTLGDFDDFDKKDLFHLHEQTFEQTIRNLKAINFHPDIIHSVYWNSGHLAMRLSQLWNISYVHSVISNGRGRDKHGAKGTAPHRIETEEEVFRNAAFILCVAESEKEEINKYYNIDLARIVVTGQYVHPSFIYASHDSYGSPRKSGINYKIEPVYLSTYTSTQSDPCSWWNKKAFTYTGRLSLDKGLHYIVQAWHLLVKKYKELCPPLWLIGGSPADIESIHPQLGVAEEELAFLEKTGKLVWWGFVDESGISAIYTRSLALITHSRYEPGGRVAVEAMCEGLPVLGTPNGFALDTIHDWHNGFLITYGDIYTLTIRMEHFIKQPYLSEIMGYQAKHISQSILLNWDFKGTHLSAYDAAMSNRHRINKDMHKIAISDFVNRKINTYPYNKILVDLADIVQIMRNNGIQNIISVQEVEMKNSSSLFWEVDTEKKKYYVKLPYDRINLFPIWTALDEQPLVISGLSRYCAEIGASYFKEIPVLLGKNDQYHVMIREKYISVDIPMQTKLNNALAKLTLFYQNSKKEAIEVMSTIRDLIKLKKDYKKIDKVYSKVSTQYFPWQNSFMDYSLQVELMRWNSYYKELLPEQQAEISHFYQNAYEKALSFAENEFELMPLINHGGCDFKNLIFVPTAVLLDNEKLHVGWPGIDYADLIITYIRQSNLEETPGLWHELLSSVAETFISPNLLVGWILLGICKESVSNAAQLKKIPPALDIRTRILLELFP